MGTIALHSVQKVDPSTVKYIYESIVSWQSLEWHKIWVSYKVTWPVAIVQ